MSEAGGDTLVLAVPSKGRLMDDSLARLAAAGFKIGKAVSARDYRGAVEGRADIEVQFVSSAEIAHRLRQGDAAVRRLEEGDLVQRASSRVCLAQLGVGHGHRPLHPLAVDGRDHRSQHLEPLTACSTSPRFRRSIMT